MTQWLAKNRVKFLLGTALLFAAGAVVRLNFIVPAFLLTLVVYIGLFDPARAGTHYRFLHLSFLFLLIFAVSYYLITNGWSVLYIPFVCVPMLAAMLFEDTATAVFLALGAAVCIAFVGGMSLTLTLYFFINGAIAAMLLKDVRRRNAIIRAGVILGVTQAVTWFFLEGASFTPVLSYLIAAANGIICSIIVVGTLPVFEYLFRTVTNITLLELADFDNPILQRLMIEAPGTYHHSLIVGNLSEAACQTIGAHALLARIGAYYHDIGKLSKPGYFSENQDISGNIHDQLSPTISKMIIMNHVKEGMDLARQYKLNSRLTDFIQQHHGTSLVYYFYRRALEASESIKQINEEGFRYPGPRPFTREIAIVLLADSVEAAVRSLKDPVPANVAEVVRKIINNKFIDGQLDECDLTLKDLEKIAAVFIRILGGIYHSRVTYPETA